MIQGKVWGTTEPLLVTPLLEIHRLAIQPQRRCSLHVHKYKFNAFLVLKGTLTIEVKKNDYPLVDKTVIGPGDLTTVKPGEYHRFVTGTEPVEAIEIYYPECLSEDIVREDFGGIVEGAKA